MKAYNTPKDELLIKSDEGEELVKITTDKTTIANLEGVLPDVTSADSGEFLRVNDAGKISTNKYPVERQTNLLYDDNVSMDGYETINLVEYTNSDNFPNLIVDINGTVVEYYNETYQYTDGNTTIVLALSDNYIQAQSGDFSVSDININITEPLTIIDPLFAEGVEEITKNANVPFTKIVAYDDDFGEIDINAALSGADVLSLMGGNSVTKNLANFSMINPKTHLLLSVPNGDLTTVVILNLNMIITLNQISYSGILTVENSTVILSAYLSLDGNIVQAIITPTPISQ